MENRSLDQRLYCRIKKTIDHIWFFFKIHENLIFNSSFIVLSVLSAFYIFIISLNTVPREINMGKDAALYLRMAETWLKGQIYIDVNYDFGLSLFMIPVILLGSAFSIDSIQSLILFFSLVGCVNMFLVTILSNDLTKNKWSRHLAVIFVIIDFNLVYLSVRPLTDTFHAMLILVIILIQIKLLKYLNEDTETQNFNIRTPLLAMSLGVCLGLLTTIRHAALILLILISLLWGVYIFRSRTSMRSKIKLISLIVLPASIITISYLFSRCAILGDIKYFFYFGANSNIWVDSYSEQWYYVHQGLPNPTFREYLQTHSLSYIVQREFLGVFQILREQFIGQYSNLLFFLALGVFVIFRKNYRINLILLAPVFYTLVVYGWLWSIWPYSLRPVRYLLPVLYLAYLIIVYAIHYLVVEIENIQTSAKSKDVCIGLSVFSVCLYLIIRASIHFTKFLVLTNGFDFPVKTAVIALTLILGIFIVVFYPKKTKESTIDNLRSVIQRYL